MKKNDSIELVIEDMGTDGEGIGHVATEDGRSIAVFVKDAVMGDTIRAAITKVKKQYVYARLVEVIKPSPYRVEPKCPVARRVVVVPCSMSATKNSLITNGTKLRTVFHESVESSIRKI